MNKWYKPHSHTLNLPVQVYFANWEHTAEEYLSQADVGKAQTS